MTFRREGKIPQEMLLAMENKSKWPSRPRFWCPGRPCETSASNILCLFASSLSEPENWCPAQKLSTSAENCRDAFDTFDVFLPCAKIVGKCLDTF